METAMALHDAAIKDEYFVKRQLAPNVDFWYVLQLAFLFQVAHFLS
jgi:citrate synthase